MYAENISNQNQLSRMSLGFFERIKHNVLLTNPEWTKEEAEEKIMKRRLDIFFCSWASLSAIVKYLDQTNISNGKSDPLLSAAPDAGTDDQPMCLA